MRAGLFAIILLCIEQSLCQIHMKDVLYQNGSLNERYEFHGGKYFLKEKEKVSSLATSQIVASCVDHNNCDNNFQQRYWTNNDYYLSGGPIFFMLGAELPMDGCAEGANSQWIVYAKQFGAKIVCMEHRYYGNSFPTSDQTPRGLQYLTSQQALADYAEFIRWYKRQEGTPNAKVVVFGGSYGGNLAAWIKEKYPNDINVAVSSSGPVNATFDMYQYMQVISQETNSDCYFALRSIFYCLQQVAAGRSGCSSSVSSPSQLPSAVNYCSPPVNWNDKSSREKFWSDIAFVWASLYPRYQNGPYCQKLLVRYNANPSDPIKAYGQFLTDIGKSWGNCAADKKKKKKKPKPKPASVTEDFISWTWQTCTEFGYFQSSDPTYGLFGSYSWSADVYADFCRKQFGPYFTDAVIQDNISKTVAYYKGQAFDGSCTIFVNGKSDPWSKLGITSQSQTSSRNTVIFIPSGEHCSDMMNYYGNSQEVKDAQDKIGSHIQQYLNDPNC